MLRQIKKAKAQVESKKQGPSAYEMVYLSQLKKELEAFLKGHNFNSISKIALSIEGSDYNTLMTVSK